jgi:hypothetical protein
LLFFIYRSGLCRLEFEVLKTDDAMNGAYEDKPGVIDVGVVREDIGVPPEFRIGAVIHGSNGNELPKLHEVLLEKEVKEKLSFRTCRQS